MANTTARSSTDDGSARPVILGTTPRMAGAVVLTALGFLTLVRISFRGHLGG